jgi:hypothetical protein
VNQPFTDCFVTSFLAMTNQAKVPQIIFKHQCRGSTLHLSALEEYRVNNTIVVRFFLTIDTKGQYTHSAVVTSILVNGKLHLHTTKGKHEHCLIQLLIAKVGKAKNYNHQELLNHGLDNKNQQDMVAVSHNTGISISYRQL